ncbi:MAG: DUF2812 domain-containing protein [Coriobacteriales bacterium]|nr:DUF2812 domain-containing protein [Coriobacteriales bacterium]
MNTLTTSTPKWKKINGNEYTLNKWDMSYDLLALEEYLNEMLALGWCPVRIRWGSQFTFVPCAPGEYICRTAMTVAKNGSYNKKGAAELSELLLADGASLVEQRNTLGSQTGIVALRPTSLGAFEINSDLDSQIKEHTARKKYHEELGAVFFVLAMAYLPIAISLNMYGFLGFFFSFLVVALYYWRPTRKYGKILGELLAKRDIFEA